MPNIILETLINARPEVCFDLMRDIRLHTETTFETDERAVSGVIDGKIGLGQTVTFEGRHLGIRQRLTVKVVCFEPPHLFVDEMTHGRFKSFRHIHKFEHRGDGTLMTDTLEWVSPYGPLGAIVDKLLLRRHLYNLVSKRNLRLKQIAEES